MKKMAIFTALAAIFAMFFSGCAHQPTTPPKSVAVLLKTPDLKLNETGILKITQSGAKLEIYGSGVGVGGLEIGEKVCVRGVCFAHTEFNEKYLKSRHYDEFLGEILRGGAIYSGAGLAQTECGFTQKISNMVYKVCGGVSEFKDAKNGVTIRITALN